MVQALKIKDTERVGDKTRSKERTVYVVRSWSKDAGAHLYLHANGTYGYKDGSPAKSEKDFDLIDDKTQKRLAVDWWKRKGQKLSQKFYEEKEKDLEARNLARGGVPIDMDVNLDFALYMRKENKKGAQFGEPQSWQEMNFAERPPWWGVMLSCSDKRFTYELSNPEAVGIKEEE
jgi:hypothetical protein